MSKNVLITGAAIRIGREIALSLCKAGWNIVIHYHHSLGDAEYLAQEIRSLQREAWLVQADLSNRDEAAAIIPALSAQGITLDVLINNAAVFERDTLATMEPAGWDTHMNINLWAPLQLIRDFSAHYKGERGHIINITDGIRGWSISPHFLSYSLSKLGLENATCMLARELAPRIHINAIAPGPTLKGKQDKEDTFDKLAQIIPLRITSTPEEVCDTVLYLLSAPSVTGQIINLSGGMTGAPVL